MSTPEQPSPAPVKDESARFLIYSMLQEIRLRQLAKAAAKDTEAA